MILSLFFTRGVSLETWVSQGLFDREKLIYEEHLRRGNLKKVYWFTYGSNDKKLAYKLKEENRLHKDIEIYQMPKIFNIPKIGSFLYSIVLPFIYRKELKESDILKTNQMDGSWSAVFAKWFYKKPLIVRTGYTLSQLEYNKNGNSLRFKFYKVIEKFAYRYCDQAIVASFHNKEYLLKQSYIVEEKIEVLPNFIDTNIFKPLNMQRYEDKILFVGRLNKEKNLFNLIEAISKTNFSLDIYGKGELKEELEEFTNEKNAKVNFLGVVPNSDLPEIYNRYKYYILPSYFEGMPKTLLEAMACGCMCIGTNVAGINEVIEDRVNGILIDGVESGDIYKVLGKVYEFDDRKISIEGIENIREKYALNGVIKRDQKILGGVA